MNAALGRKTIRSRQARRMLVTLAVSAPVIFWMIWLLG